MLFFRQRRSVFLSLLCLLAVLLVAKFSSPLFLKAQSSPSALAALTSADTGGDNVGSHVGEGDSIAQVNIINNVIAANGGGPGFPVTILMYTNSSPADVQKVAEAIKKNSFFPIVRIDQTCTATAAESIRMVGLVRQYFGPDTIIAFGNEINNKDIECKNWAVYQQNYQAVKGANILPSAIDFYMGNPAYTYDKLPASLWSLITSSGIRAANAYGCIGATAATCDDAAMGTYKTGLTGTQGKQLYVTEFSLSPGNRDASSPDSDLAKVISFIKKYAPQVPAQKITPLIRNVCNKDGEWLIYVKGQVFTKSGRNVTKSCANIAAASYEFNIQRESSQGVVNNFYDEYSVACLPKEQYGVGFENIEKCGKPGVSCPADWKSWNIPGKLKFSAEGKVYGLFRNEAAVASRRGTDVAPTRVESVEGFISTPNQNQSSSVPTTSAADKSDVSIQQAPIYTLTTMEQQCTFVVNKLKAVRNLCSSENRVDTYSIAGKVSPTSSSEECGLNTNIPGTSTKYDQEGMLGTFQGKNMSCEALIRSTDPADQQFLTDLLKVNVALDTAYRPAFIVAVTTFDDPASTSNVTTHATDDSGASPLVSGKFQVVDYLEVRVPAIATDFLPPESTAQSSSLINPERNNYRDPIQLTADALRTTDSQDAAVEQEIADRAQLRAFESRGTISGPIIGNNGSMPFFCKVNGKLVPNCNVPTKSGAEYQDQVPPALIKFLNASASVDTRGAWDQLPCEASEVDIYGPANKKQIAEQGQSITAKLNAQKIGPYEKSSSISANITAKVIDVTKGGNIQTYTQLYFVTPQRYQLQYAQTSFLSFMTLAQQGGFKVDGDVDQVVQDVFNPSKFSPLLKTELGKNLSGQVTKTGGFEFLGTTTISPPITAPVTTPVGITGPTTPIVVPNIKRFDLVGLLKDTSEDPKKHSVFWRVAGQVASLPTRMMTLLTTAPGSPVNEYTRGCEGNFATDNWFSGNCLKAKDVVSTPIVDTVGNVCIETKIDDPAVLADYASKLAGYLSLPATRSLWTAYYSGYLPNASVYLFSVNDAKCDASQPCYQKVLDAAVANKINPYLAIAIALNETGGFKSNQADASGPHFGCGVNPDPNGATIGSGSISSKLQCMVGAFNTYASQGLDANASLSRYGYANGARNANLTKIIGMISNNSYKGVTCP